MLKVILLTLYPTYSVQDCRRPGAYLRGQGAQGRIHPGWGTSSSEIMEARTHARTHAQLAN